VHQLTNATGDVKYSRSSDVNKATTLKAKAKATTPKEKAKTNNSQNATAVI